MLIESGHSAKPFFRIWNPVISHLEVPPPQVLGRVGRRVEGEPHHLLPRPPLEGVLTAGGVAEAVLQAIRARVGPWFR